MAAWTARRDVVLLRPLLDMTPEALKAFLQERGVGWVDDPSNADPRFERARLRAAGAAANANPAERQDNDARTASFLAGNVTLRPQGFAVIAADSAPAPALAALLRTIGGRDYPPPRAAVAALAVQLRPATLGGVQIARSRGGWLLAREPAGCAPDLPARAGACWDRRYRLAAGGPAGASFGALGKAAARYRGNDLPSLVLRAMPCLRLRDGGIVFPAPATFAPPAPVASHPFLA